MTPQQKLERLIELGNEAREIISSLWDDKESVQPIGIRVDRKDVEILCYNDALFVTEFNTTKTMDDEVWERYHVEVDGVSLTALKELKEETA